MASEVEDGDGRVGDQPDETIGTPKGLQSAGNGLSVMFSVVFLITLLFPMRIHAGPLLLLPYRLWLLILFVPLLVVLLRGKAGRLVLVDWAFFGAAIWAVLSLMVNHPFGTIIEPAGSYTIEFLGAYLLGRVTIRSGADFFRMVKAFFLLILALFPFALAESTLHRPVLLQLLGQDRVAVDIGTRMGLRRAQTVFEHPILFGAFVSSGLGLVWYSLPITGKRFIRPFSAGIVAAATFLSLSSGALMSLSMQAFFIAWEFVLKSYRRRWALFGWGAAAIYIVVDLFSTASPFHVLVRYATFSLQSSYNRILIWHYGTQNVLENPLFGLGLNDWVRPRWMSASVDNFWLLVAMRYGLPFFLMLAIGLVFLIRKVSRAPLESDLDRSNRAAFLTTLGGIVLAGGTVHYWNGVFAFNMFLVGSGVWMISGGAEKVEKFKDLLPRENLDNRGR